LDQLTVDLDLLILDHLEPNGPPIREEQADPTLRRDPVQRQFRKDQPDYPPRRVGADNPPRESERKHNQQRDHVESTRREKQPAALAEQEYTQRRPIPNHKEPSPIEAPEPSRDQVESSPTMEHYPPRKLSNVAAQKKQLEALKQLQQIQQQEREESNAGSSRTNSVDNLKYELYRGSVESLQPYDHVEAQQPDEASENESSYEKSDYGDEEIFTSDMESDRSQYDLVSQSPRPRRSMYAAKQQIFFEDLDETDLDGVEEELDNVIETGKVSKRMSVLIRPAMHPVQPRESSARAREPHREEPNKKENNSLIQELEQKQRALKSLDAFKNYSESIQQGRTATQPSVASITEESPFPTRSDPKSTALSSSLRSKAGVVPQNGSMATSPPASQSRISPHQPPMQFTSPPTLAPYQRANSMPVNIQNSQPTPSPSHQAPQSPQYARPMQSPVGLHRSATQSAKVSRALERLKTAQVKKVAARVYIQDDSDSRTVYITSLMNSESVVEYVIEKAQLGEEKAPWVLFELFEDLQLERPIRLWEPVVNILQSWEQETQNALLLRPYRLYDTISYAAHGKVLPAPRGQLYLETKSGVFKKRDVELRHGSEIQVQKGNHEKGTLTAAIVEANASGADADRHVSTLWTTSTGGKKSWSQLCTLARFDIYTPIQLKRRAPTKYCFALKSDQRMGLFEDLEAGYVFFFCAESEEALRSWVLALRNVKAHVDKCLHPEWFEQESPDLAPRPHATNAPGGAHTSLARAQSFHKTESPMKGLVGKMQQGLAIPTQSTTQPIPGKPLLGFDEDLSGFNLAQPTLLSQSMSASNGGAFARSFNRAVRSSQNSGPTSASPTGMHRNFGADDDDDEQPLVRPSPGQDLRMRNQGMARSQTVINRSRSKSTARPSIDRNASGLVAPLGVSPPHFTLPHQNIRDDEGVGGKGTLLDRIERSKESNTSTLLPEPASYASGSALPKRSLIEMIPRHLGKG
jgi:hypothetical protein